MAGAALPRKEARGWAAATSQAPWQRSPGQPGLDSGGSACGWSDPPIRRWHRSDFPAAPRLGPGVSRAASSAVGASPGASVQRGREVRGRPNPKPRSLHCLPLLPSSPPSRRHRTALFSKGPEGAQSGDWIPLNSEPTKTAPQPGREHPGETEKTPTKEPRERRGWLRGGSSPKAAGGGRRARSKGAARSPWRSAERPGLLGRGRRCPGPPPSGRA